MKRITALFLSLTILFALSACGSHQAERPGAPPVESAEPAPETTPAPTPEAALSETREADGSRVLVAYFSATGNTGAVAETIAETVGADLYELVPEQPYTEADLNWNDPGSRVNAEHEDAAFRTAIAGEAKDLSGYDAIFIGYPLWWRQAPGIVRGFVESSELAGKTMIPFCTSMSDGIGSSGESLEALAPGAVWLEGRRFGESGDETAAAQWAGGLGLPAA